MVLVDGWHRVSARVLVGSLAVVAHPRRRPRLRAPVDQSRTGFVSRRPTAATACSRRSTRAGGMAHRHDRSLVTSASADAPSGSTCASGKPSKLLEASRGCPPRSSIERGASSPGDVAECTTSKPRTPLRRRAPRRRHLRSPAPPSPRPHGSSPAARRSPARCRRSAPPPRAPQLPCRTTARSSRRSESASAELDSWPARPSGTTAHGRAPPASRRPRRAR